MKNTILYLAFLSLFAFVATGCADDEYDADTAVSYYKPYEYEKMVSSITVTSTVKVNDINRDFKWTYDFAYDAQNRIKEITGNARYFLTDFSSYCERTHSSKYFYNNEELKIKYVSNEHVLKSGEKYKRSGEYSGVFREDHGNIELLYWPYISYWPYTSFRCYYDLFGRLESAYTDRDTSFGLELDDVNNIVKAYQMDSLENPLSNATYEYVYSSYKNKTNIDFASFLGYNIIERTVPVNEFHPYELFHLGAFEMLGARGEYLPIAEWVYNEGKKEKELKYGKWVFDDEGYPIEFESPKGRKYTIKYMQ